MLIKGMFAGGSGGQLSRDGAEPPYAVATDGVSVYWANVESNDPFHSSIRKVSVSGGGVTTVVGPIDVGPIAVDATSVYWIGFDGATNGVFKSTK